MSYILIMNKVAIPKTEYRQLQRQADAYKKMVSNLHALILHDSIRELVDDFRKTELYTEGFIRDLENGLRKSSYARGK